MLEKEIGVRIKQRRKELNLTLQDIADRVHVARSTIQRYEAGTIGQMKMPVLYSIAQALNVNPDWLIGKSDVMAFPDPKSYIYFYDSDGHGVGAGTPESIMHQLAISSSEYDLILAYRQASPDDRQIIDNIVSRYAPKKGTRAV